MVNTKWKGIPVLTAMAASVPASVCCSCKRTYVIIKPRMHSNSDELVKTREGVCCTIRIFALQMTIVSGVFRVMRRPHIRKGKVLKKQSETTPKTVVIERTQNIVCFNSSVV